MSTFCKTPKGVTKYVKLAAKAGLQWPQVQAMDEMALHTRLMGTPRRASTFVAPDYGDLHQELRRKGMTLMLLWQEHSALIAIAVANFSKQFF